MDLSGDKQYNRWGRKTADSGPATALIYWQVRPRGTACAAPIIFDIRKPHTIMLTLLSALIFAALPATASAAPQSSQEIATPKPQPEQRTAAPGPLALVDAARGQIGVTLKYDPAYQRLAYPNGDVPIERGVCTDVVVRAYRKMGIDLQVLVHQDLKKAWGAYPHQSRWQLTAPDKNIDHRRVPNLATFFARRSAAMPPSRDAKSYLPGDVVTWNLSQGLTHIGIVSDKLTKQGIPLIIHNIGSGAREENLLFDYPITGHYRWHPGGAEAGRN
jgi:uncharacterized protein YijF (DUF1287 family)